MTVLNRDILPGNVCFGCGHENPDGLKIEVRRDTGGALLAEGTFEVVPLPPDRLLEIAGLERLPESWSRLLERDNP